MCWRLVLSLMLLGLAGCHSEAISPGSTMGSGGEPGSNAADGGQANSAGGLGASEGVPLIPNDGWIEGQTNTLGIEGGVSVTADPATSDGLSTTLDEGRICLHGAAARVDLGCNVTPGQDCYDQHFGAIVRLSLNQSRDEEPQPFDGTSITGMAFELSGPVLPSTMTFGVETDQGEYYCRLVRPGQPVLGSDEPVWMTQLKVNCHSGGATPSVASVMPSLLGLRWQVRSGTKSDMPFDFCIENLRALTK